MMHVRHLTLFIFIFLCGILPALGQPQSKDTIVTMQDVVVLASRKPEALMAAPTSIQHRSRSMLENNAAISFFDALAYVKGVQMITPSMGFRIVNTRGFNNTTNVRIVQLVDGLDVQSPHIGSPIGNAMGPSDLDIEKVEVLPGLAATMYGMNAINGLADFATRDPFTATGLSFSQKTAVTLRDHAENKVGGFTETSVRYAQKLGQYWAFKINITQMQGQDWIADDRTDLSPTVNMSTGLSGSVNPAMDPVNGYGNESANRRTLNLGGRNYVVARTGYFEQDVVDYGLSNLKGDVQLKWRNQRGRSISFTSRMARLNNVYQRANRFRLQDYLIMQHALQFAARGISGKIYFNAENTGRSYNLRSMAENLDRLAKSDAAWFSDYASAFNSLNNGQMSVIDLHAGSRIFADRSRLQPGTEAFFRGLSRLQNINNWDSGAALRVKAAFLQADVQWNLTDHQLKTLKEKAGIDLMLGADFRQYFTKPDGNYFINPIASKQEEDLLYKKIGAFASMQKSFRQDKIKIGLILRADKNDYFRTYFSPRLTTVWRPNTNTTFRLNLGQGYRFPIIFEAFSNVNSGGVKRVGGLPVMSNGIFENGWLQTSIAAFQSAVLTDMNRNGTPRDLAIQRNAGLLKKNPYTYLRPEQMNTIEAGFRKIFWKGRMLFDADAYLSDYRDFIAQVNINVPNRNIADSVAFLLYDKTGQRPYRMWTNSTSVVRNHGFSVGLTYRQPRSVLFSVHVDYTKLKIREKQDGLEDGFNTPPWTCAATLSTHEWKKSWRAGINWRWQDSFQWVSFLVSGKVPAFHTLDAFWEYRMPKQPVRLKWGANNLLNQSYRSFLGGPSVGGFYYMNLTFGMN
jgi:outer membrane receptor protein involved in Fe transport